MPKATIRFIRAAWIWFVVGLALGAVLVGAKAGWLHPRLLGLRPTHIHVMALGWGAQWIFGIAFWIYPAWGSERTGPGPERAMALCWILLNAGTLVRATGEAAFDLALAPTFGANALGAGALLQLSAGLCFVAIIRTRIRGTGWIRRSLDARRLDEGSSPIQSTPPEPPAPPA